MRIIEERIAELMEILQKRKAVARTEFYRFTLDTFKKNYVLLKTVSPESPVLHDAETFANGCLPPNYLRNPIKETLF